MPTPLRRRLRTARRGAGYTVAIAVVLLALLIAVASQLLPLVERNPERVVCIYGDAPVCDFKSWPGQKSGKAWEDVKALYGFKDDAEALAFKGNPVDILEPLAKAGIPLIHVVGDTDTTVPVAANTALIEQRYKALGGTITVFHKPGVGHHPHGLDDPKPLVDLIKTYTAKGAPAAAK